MRTFQIARSIGPLAHVPDGKALWVGDAFGRVHQLDFDSGTAREVFRVASGRSTWPVQHLGASADGKFLLAASAFPWVLWDVEAARSVPPPPLAAESRRALLSPDGSMVFLSGGTRGWTLWDRRAGEVRHFRDYPPATAATFSPDNTRLAVRSYTGPGMTVYDTRSGAPVAALSQGFGDPTLFSADGSRLIGASLPEITVWDTTTWRAAARFRVGAAFPRYVALHPTGKLLAVSVDGPLVSFSDLQGRSRGRFDWGVGKVRGLSFAPDGLTAAVGGTRGLVAVWDVDAPD